MMKNFLGKPTAVCNEKMVRDNYEKLTKSLIEKGFTITTMESATAGQIASLITDTEGSSAIMKGAFITYSNEAKVMNGVPEEIIEKYSVYSKETAGAMAKACKEFYNADIGIGVTGTMGNIDPKNADDSVVGQVFFAICVSDETKTFERIIPHQPTRLLYKLFVADVVCLELNKMIGEM